MKRALLIAAALAACAAAGATPQPTEVVLSPEALRSYVGSYPLAPTFIITVTEEDGSVYAQATGQQRFQIYPSAKDEFFYKVVDAQITFERDSSGNVVALILHQNGINQRAPKGEPPPLPAEVVLPREVLRSYVGSYPLAPAFIITVTEEDGSVYAQATGQQRFQIYPSAKDEFFYKVVNAQISFERDPSGKVVALVLHQNGANPRALKGEPPVVPAEVVLPQEVLRSYVGSYPLAPAFVLTVTEQAGNVYAQATGQPRAQIYPSARDEFFYTVVNAQISFKRDGAGNVTGLVLHQNGRNMPAQRAPDQTTP